MLRNWVDAYEEFGVSPCYHEIMFNYFHLVEIRKGFGSISKEKRREPKTGDGNKPEHVTVLWFLGLMCKDLHFFNFFSRNYTF